MALKTYIIERDIPGVDQMSPQQLKEASAASNAVLDQLGPKVRWLESFVAKDKTFCVYQAEDEQVIQEHARLSGFPASRITEVGGKIGPATAGA